MNASSTLWLYGSYARGDFDHHSDIDLLLIEDREPTELAKQEAIEIAKELGYGQEGSHEYAVSAYTWTEIEEMAKYGSLFLQHVGREAKQLAEGSAASGRLRRVLAELPVYERAPRDLKAFSEGIADVRESVTNNGSPQYETTVLATIVRHSSVLGCYLAGKPDFGRLSPVIRITRDLSVDRNVSESLLDLCRQRGSVERSTSDTILIEPADILIWCENADRLIQQINKRFGYELH